ncbi:PAS domain-containing protein [Rhodovibrionaceae bacterium A322]
MTPNLPSFIDKQEVSSADWRCFEPLYSYWLAKHHENDLPRREDLDPLDIPDLLADLALIEVVSQEGHATRLRFRLMGTHLALHLGRDLTGEWLDDLQIEGTADLNLSAHSKTIRERRVTFAKGQIQVQGRKPVDYTSIQLPLSDGENQVNMLVALYHFTPRSHLPPH